MRYLCVLVLVVVPTAAFAVNNGSGQATTSGASQGGTATVTVTIPGVIGVDVETDLAFDFRSVAGGFGTYDKGAVYATPTAATTGNCGTVGSSSTFPPQPECAGDAFYLPQVNVTDGLEANASNNHLWLSIFSSKGGQQATMDLKASISSVTYGITDVAGGSSVADIRYKVGSAHNTAINGATFGPAARTAFTTTPTTILTGTLTSSLFGWTRVDQEIDMKVTNAGTATFDDGAVAPTLTYTLSY